MMEDGYDKWSEEEHQVVFFRWVDEQISGGNTQYVTLGAIPNGAAVQMKELFLH
jgi:hypothetical protein